MNLYTPVREISGIGPVFQKKLKRLGIKNIRDLLFHFPHRYEDFSNIKNIADVKIGETCCIKGEIVQIESGRTWKKRMSITQALIKDGTGTMEAVWFNQPYLVNVLKKGDAVCLAGKAVPGKKSLYLSNPIREKVSKSDLNSLTHTGRIVPVYPETEGLSSRWLRYFAKSFLQDFKGKIKDPLPEDLREKEGLTPLERSLWQIHFPDSLKAAQKARKRFAFEELFNIELWVLKERMKMNKEKAFQVPLDLKLIKRFVDSLPFKLTDAQRKSAWQILKDLEKKRPMNRLLEGDVGSGKTVVAAMAILNAAKKGYQSVFMAPTEILANQHFKTIWDLLKRYNINVGLLTGKKDVFYSRKLHNQYIEISRKKLLEKTDKGEISLLIGTHALIASGKNSREGIKFGKLALVVIDEQHRFGVEQRAKLTRQKTIPHLLSMTATPIPRTLALTLYGDLDLSIIDQLPKGRKKIITKVVPPKERQKTYAFIKKEVKKGRKVFVICPRIEEEGKLETKTVKEEYQKLSQKIFPDLKVGMLHGKMQGREKEKTMREFSKDKGKIDILVSTSVVEVGVDVTQATVMMIEGADRFGLAQLHQFRGRVGRSKYQSFCFLFTDSGAAKTRQRLKALASSENGFDLAEKDLQIRGPGDFSGIRQWGVPDLTMESLNDMPLVEKTRQAAKEILEKDPELEDHPLLLERIGEFGRRIHLE